MAKKKKKTREGKLEVNFQPDRLNVPIYALGIFVVRLLASRLSPVLRCTRAVEVIARVHVVQYVQSGVQADHACRACHSPPAMSLRRETSSAAQALIW